MGGGVSSDVFSFLKFRLIVEKDLLAVNYLHHKMFPVRYGKVFCEKICKESDDPPLDFNTISLEEYEERAPFGNWKSEQLFGIGVFCPYAFIQDPLLFPPSEIDNNLLVGDEYLIGIITFLINFPDDNILLSGKSEYMDFYKYYKFFSNQSEMDNCRMINTNLISIKLYNMLGDSLYSNDKLLNRLDNVLYNKTLESVYILTIGVIDSFQCIGIGTSLILFVQLLFHRVLYGNVITLDNDRVSWVRSTRAGVQTQEIPPFIYLHVIDYNESALKMYNKTNFAKIARVKGYYSFNSVSYDAYMLGYYID